MPQFRRSKFNENFLRFFSPKKEIVIEFNWLKISSVWMLIVFGFYGWGSLSFSKSASLPSALTSIAIATVFSFYYFFSNHYAAKLVEKLTIEVRQIYFSIGIFLLLVAINMDWISRSLTGDEVAYALQAQSQGYVISKKVLTIIPQLGSLSFRILLQIFSGLLLLAFILLLVLISRLKNIRHYILVCFLGTLVLRSAVIAQGGAGGANPPGASFFYFVGTTILSPSNFTYRVLSLFFASIFLTIVYVSLSKLPYLSKFTRILIVLFVLSIPLFRHMALLSEISIWNFYFATIALIRVLISRGSVSYQLIFIGAMATSLRFPIVAILIPLYASQFVGVGGKGLKFRRSTTFIRSSLGLLLCLPGFIWIGTTRFLDKYGRANATSGNFNGQISEVKQSIQEVFSTLTLTTSKGLWIICLIGLLLFMGNTFFNYFFIGLLTVFEFLFFIVFNSGDVVYASKYIIEWFIPFTVFGLVVIASKFRYGKVGHYFLAICLILVIAFNVIDYGKMPAKFVKASISLSSGDLIFDNTVRVLVSVPYLYGSAFDTLRKDKELANCLNTGIVYGVYPQILEGYLSRDVLASILIDHKFLLAQEAIHENWVTASATSIEESGTKCVIVGFVDEQRKIINQLMANNWIIRDEFFDRSYHTKVFILSR